MGPFSTACPSRRRRNKYLTLLLAKGIVVARELSERGGPPMSKLADAFNRGGFSRFLNSPGGRVFRFVGGVGFLAVGYLYRYHALGIVSMVWGLLAISAGAFDVCYFSLVLGGPFSGAKI